MELEKARQVLNNMDIEFSGEATCKECVFDDDTHCIKDSGEDCQMIAIKTVLQALENSISKEKVKEEMERIEDYFDRLNGPDEDIKFIKEVKQKLLGE